MIELSRSIHSELYANEPQGYSRHESIDVGYETSDGSSGSVQVEAPSAQGAPGEEQPALLTPPPSKQASKMEPVMNEQRATVGESPSTQTLAPGVMAAKNVKFVKTDVELKVSSFLEM